MKSSESDTLGLSETNSENTFLLQSPFYALLAALIPLSILASFLPLSVLFLQWFLGPVFFPQGLPLGLCFGFALFSAISASIYWAIIKKSKASHKAANIRGAILMLIFSYSLGSLLDFDFSLGMRFLPSFFNIPPALSALFVLFPVLNNKMIFNGQELFESHIRSYQGERLRQIVLQDSSFMGDADEDIKKMIWKYGASFIPSLVLFLLCGVLGIPLGFPLMVLLLILFTFAVSVITFLIFLRREYVYATEGLSLSGRARALTAAIIFVLAATGLGFLFSSHRSILSPGLILDFFRWFLALFPNRTRPIEAPPPLPSFGPALQRFPPEFLEELAEVTGPSPFWEWVKYGALILLVFLFLWFMIHPLLGRSRFLRGLRFLPGKAASSLLSWLNNLIRGLTLFFKSLREDGWKGLSSISTEALRSLEDQLLESYSPAKKREMRRSISLFARLIYWGSEVLKVPWKPSHAPAEYCGLLAAAAGEELGLIRAGDLFEKALYSFGPLSRNERKEFKQLVERITIH